MLFLEFDFKPPNPPTCAAAAPQSEVPEDQRMRCLREKGHPGWHEHGILSGPDTNRAWCRSGGGCEWHGIVEDCKS